MPGRRWRRHGSGLRDGGYDVPGPTAPAPGVYRWSVALAGNTYNLPAAACGEKVVVKAVPLLSVESSDGSVGRGTRVRARFRVARLPDGYADQVAVRLYGPFATRAAVDCSDRHLARRRTVEVTGPATHGTTAPVSLRRAGVYAWQAVLPAALLSTREVTPCGGAGSTVRVG